MPSLDLGPVVGPQGEQGATGAQGIRGEQGLPGPNQVTNSTATPLTGVLTGNGGVVGVESIDAAPTADSTGFARSGGTHDAIKARVPVYGKGKNLLDNGAFVVNQRGVTSGSLSAATYVRDRWVMNLCSYTFNDDGSVTYAKTTANDAFLIQYTSHDLHGWLAGKTVTVSAVVDGEIQKVTITMPANNNTWTLGGGVTLRIYTNYYGDASKERYEFQFYHSNTSGVRFGPVMAELGEESTMGHIENGTVILNSLPDYDYELFRCMTSTADSTDTYANKTLATGQEIAYVENGTTATKTNGYAVGEYFCWHGLLYRAKTAIGNGDTFTVNTNCEQVTVGDEIRDTGWILATASTSGTTTYYRKSGKIVSVTVDVNANVMTNSWQEVALLPSGFRPKNTIYNNVYDYDGRIMFYAISEGGSVQIRGTSVNPLSFEAVFFAN